MVGRRAWVTLGGALLVLATALAACGEDGVLQGEPYATQGALPIDPPSLRDACGEAGCPVDAGPTPVPERDAGADAGVTALPSNTCTTARAIGTVAGDAPSPPVTTTGTCAEFVSVRATEQNNNALGTAMRLRITMSPAGHDFDLYAFLNPGQDQLACTSPYARSETNGVVPETIDLQWGEGSVANGSDDSRTVVLAVTSASGPCPPGSSWSLTVTGNP